jgi:hypothetical protein
MLLLPLLLTLLLFALLVEATGLLLLPALLPQYPSSLGAAAAAEAVTGDDEVMVPLAAANANSDVCLSARWC